MKITWKTFLAVSAYWAGGIWCVGYMISEYFKESK